MKLKKTLMNMYHQNLLSIAFLAWLFFSVGCIHAQEKDTPTSGTSTDQHATDSPAFTNALVKESSPYLLMHAHNPVNWRPWNQESLALAKQQDKVIFLSIGYSSCHWCHVMERESFLDLEIAKFLNEHFVCIKVDREERLDVDEIYMQSLLIINQGRGGWPLSMFLTPAGKPFFGGTYWPARDGDRNATMGFLTLIKRVHESYTDHKPDVLQTADQVTEVTRKALASRTPTIATQVNKNWSTDTVAELADRFDSEFGGFGFNPNQSRLPKFPEPSNLLFLADQLQRNRLTPTPQANADIESMLVTTCERMQQGGIYDHLGGGFHRYSVDRFWQIPHFEKMLYDNGQLASVYAQAYSLTRRDSFRRTVEGILAFVQRELTSPKGAFYSSLDAESEGEEGKFYRWTKDEIKELLSPEEFELFSAIYQINQPPNFEGRYYAPQLSQSIAKHAAALALSESELETKLRPIRKKLFDARANRIGPLRDGKILTAWNGLMIRGFADAGRLLENPSYVDAAAKAADAVLTQAVQADGRVLRTFSDNQPAKLNGYLIDYACLVDGMIALHRATEDPKWLDQAQQIQQRQNALFWDKKLGGYFNTSADHEVLIARSKIISDRAMPSGNSVSAGNLLYLGRHLNKEDYLRQAKQTVLAASAILDQQGALVPRMLLTSESLK